jgi:methylase of polypeptide subunit release factors
MHAGGMTSSTTPAAPVASVAPRGIIELGRALQAAGYRFTTVTPATHRRVNGRDANARARDLRGVFGWSRPFAADALPAPITALVDAADLAEPAEDGLRRSRVRASSIGDRLYFHSAFPTDDDDAIFFGPDTYRYVAALARTLPLVQPPIRRAVDIGAGSGAGAIELALLVPDAEVVATDINPAALAMTEANAQLNGAPNIVTRRSDLLDGTDGEFDLVMSNPPYILDRDELPYRHGGGEHGEDISICIVRTALDRLRPGGSLMLYTGVAIVEGEDRLLAAVRQDLDERCATWTYEELDPDIFGGQLGCDGYERVERIAAVWLHAVKR